MVKTLKHDSIAANPATQMSREPVDVHQPPSVASKKMRVLTGAEVARAVELAGAQCTFSRAGGTPRGLIMSGR